MPKLFQVTIPHSTYAELQRFLTAPSSPSSPQFCFILATLLAQMIGHVRMFQTTKEDLPNVLEWSIDTDTRASVFLTGPANLATEMEQLKDTLEKLSSPQSTSDIDVFLGLSLDPTDESLSIDVTTEPVLEVEDLATLAASPTAAPSPRVEDFHVPLDDVYFTASRAAELLGVNKSTITRRIRKNELIGFRIFKNALRIPKDQFKDGDVVDGIADVLSLFESHSEEGNTFVDHKSAWAFLDSTIYPGNVAPRPIDRLRDTSIDRPVSAVLAEIVLAKQSLDYGDHI